MLLSVDLFELEKLTKGNVLLFGGSVLMEHHCVLEKIRMKQNVCDNFLKELDAGCLETKNTPYHNSVHALDACQTLHMFLKNKLTDVLDLSPLEVLGALVAALTHDFKHPGCSNQFMIQTQSELAMLYNDKSPLENMHLAEAFKMLNGPKNCNIFETLDANDYATVRSVIIHMVLGTDMNEHFANLATFDTQCLDRGVSNVPADYELNRMLILKMGLHVADISSATKATPVYMQWHSRVMEEFFAQGDRERELGNNDRISQCGCC